MRHVEVQAGDRYSRLAILAEVSGQRRTFLCQCDCGAKAEVVLCDLRSSHTKSCGCITREGIPRTHGMNRTRTHNAWMSMKARCSGRTKDAKHYPGRGISICARWLNSFEAFFEDMGECPEGRELERINNDGNYEPGNCKWATRLEQTRNTRRSRMLTHNGKTQCVTAWAEEVGIASSTIYKRLKYGFPVESALATPVYRLRGTEK